MCLFAHPSATSLTFLSCLYSKGPVLQSEFRVTSLVVKVPPSFRPEFLSSLVVYQMGNRKIQPFLYISRNIFAIFTTFRCTNLWRRDRCCDRKTQRLHRGMLGKASSKRTAADCGLPALCKATGELNAERETEA